MCEDSQRRSLFRIPWCNTQVTDMKPLGISHSIWFCEINEGCCKWCQSWGLHHRWCIKRMLTAKRKLKGDLARVSSRSSFKCKFTFHGYFQIDGEHCWKFSVSGNLLLWVGGLRRYNRSPWHSYQSFGNSSTRGISSGLIILPLMACNHGGPKEQKGRWGGGEHFQYVITFSFYLGGYFLFHINLVYHLWAYSDLYDSKFFIIYILLPRDIYFKCPLFVVFS